MKRSKRDRPRPEEILLEKRKRKREREGNKAGREKRVTGGRERRENERVNKLKKELQEEER